MFKQFLKVIVGADFYMVTSFLIFLLFFIAVSVWLLRVDKGYIERSKMVPFNDGEEPAKK
jgi:cbb3-type cytochrome oxidase subunit 3